MIDLYAAIELRDGRCRRPCQTKTGATTDALEAASYFLECGVAGLHLVDLDAKSGRPSRSRVVIASIATRSGVPVQVDSGAATRLATESMLDTEAERVILDPAALEEPGLVEWLGLKYPERVLVALDASEPSAPAVAGRLGDAGVALLTVAYRSESDLAGLRGVIGSTRAGVLAMIDDDAAHDVETLAGLEVDGSRHLDGVILGGPLYAGPGRVAGALEICN